VEISRVHYALMSGFRALHRLWLKLYHIIALKKNITKLNKSLKSSTCHCGQKQSLWCSIKVLDRNASFLL